MTALSYTYSTLLNLRVAVLRSQEFENTTGWTQVLANCPFARTRAMVDVVLEKGFLLDMQETDVACLVELMHRCSLLAL